jgi:hypothetical protein
MCAAFDGSHGASGLAPVSEEKDFERVLRAQVLDNSKQLLSIKAMPCIPGSHAPALLRCESNRARYQ